MTSLSCYKITLPLYFQWYSEIITPNYSFYVINFIFVWCSMLANDIQILYFGLRCSKDPYPIFESESESEVVQSCPTLCNPMDCSPAGSSVHGILQARILEWVAISFSRGSSQPRDRTRISCIEGRCFNLWPTLSLLSS